MNWTKLLSDILASGMSQADIARHIGVTQSAVSHVLNQKSQKGFRFEPGQKLIALHKKVSRAGQRKCRQLEAAQAAQTAEQAAA
jgi:predicted transcriptional regulator